MAARELESILGLINNKGLLRIDWDNARQCKECLCFFTSSPLFFHREQKKTERNPLGLSVRCKFCVNLLRRNRYQFDSTYRTTRLNYDREHRGTEEAIRRMKDYNLQYAFKGQINLEMYEIMVANQQGKCAICDQPSKLEVDHDHTTGKIRSLLCGPCNRALGGFKENPTVLYKAALYLEQHQGNEGIK